MSGSTLAKAVCSAMQRIAPLRLAEKWDNVGLLLEMLMSGPESPVIRPSRGKVLLTIDLTPSVFEESTLNDVSVIVAYHPPIFKPLQSFTLSNPLQSSLLKCAARGISVYSPHTSVDSVWGGVNDWLAQGVLSGQRGTVSPLVGEKLSPTSGESEGAEGRLVTLEDAVSLNDLQGRIKTHLNLQHIQVGMGLASAGASNSVRTIAICAGSGGSMLLGKDADVYFTGEMSHHEVLAAVAAGKHVILCGHTNTERGYLPVLAAKLRAELAGDGHGEAEVLVSQADKHPLDIV
ncbi:hypothetical protein V5O48_015278 [Marasmius crinis-equi]|uniref:Nif3-like dinuclear metal center hexameric protein n=1 Tax=Marasmius crinis-equi TaxID=585013 RepID=A0ABR3EV94_9AGAR